jgi:hypothetical protein
VCFKFQVPEQVQGAKSQILQISLARTLDQPNVFPPGAYARFPKNSRHSLSIEDAAKQQIGILARWQFWNVRLVPRDHVGGSHEQPRPLFAYMKAEPASEELDNRESSATSRRRCRIHTRSRPRIDVKAWPLSVVVKLPRSETRRTQVI